MPVTGPVLGIVPVRAHSQSLRNKSLQLVDGEPLLLRTLRKVAPLVDQLVVSTNDPTVAGMARLWGHHVDSRPEALGGPDVPLAPVIAHAARDFKTGIVACFQVTVPFIAPETIVAMLAAFRHAQDDWWVAVAPCEGIHWQAPVEGAMPAPIQDRINRQQSGFDTPRRETGVQVMTADYARNGVGTALGTYRISADEALDIDTIDDLVVARHRARRRHVHFLVKVSPAVGSGHLHRALTLADAMSHHRVTMGLQVGAPDWARALRNERGYETWDGNDKYPTLIVTDRLATTREEITAYQARGSKVATFEDTGSGRYHADLLINELLPGPTGLGERLFGPEVAVLRPEFSCHPPHRKPGAAQRALVTFGGTDPAGLNLRVAKVLLKHHPDLALRLALGPGVCDTGLAGTFRNVEEDRLGFMAEHMAWADLVITAQGRTQYEAAAMGVPTITIAANERESRHIRCPGHIHLGLHATVSDAHLAEVIDNVLTSPALRGEMADTARAAVDGRGTERVVEALDRLMFG